jgi:hypothetical protein
MLTSQRQQLAVISHIRTDIGAPQSGHAQEATPSSSGSTSPYNVSKPDRDWPAGRSRPADWVPDSVNIRADGSQMAVTANCRSTKGIEPGTGGQIARPPEATAGIKTTWPLATRSVIINFRRAPAAFTQFAGPTWPPYPES